MALPKLNNARYDIVIPSTGKTVSYRPYLVKEEKILMMAMETNDEKQIMNATKDVIKSCVHDDINVDDLAMFDVETLFLALRSKSVGESIELNFKCDDCSATNDIKINFADIKTPEVVKENATVMLTDSVGVTLKYPSYADVGSAQKKSNELDAAFDLMLSSIDTIFDDDGVYPASGEKDSDLKDFLDSLNNDQLSKVSEFFNTMPSLSYDIDFDCVSCGKNNTQELRGLQSFFT